MKGNSGLRSGRRALEACASRHPTPDLSRGSYAGNERMPPLIFKLYIWLVPLIAAAVVLT